jgi:hypothetical protein
MMKQASLGDPCFLRDPRERRAAAAVTREVVHGDAEELLAPLSALLRSTRRHFDLRSFTRAPFGTRD